MCGPQPSVPVQVGLNKKQKNIVFFLFVKETVMPNFMKTGKMQGTQFSLTYCPFVFVDYFEMNFYIYLSRLHNMLVNFAVRYEENKLPILIFSDILSVF